MVSKFASLLATAINRLRSSSGGLNINLLLNHRVEYQVEYVERDVRKPPKNEKLQAVLQLLICVGVKDLASPKVWRIDFKLLFEVSLS